MAWSNLTYAFLEVLTSAKMTLLDENLDALAAGSAGAPPVLKAALPAAIGYEDEANVWTQLNQFKDIELDDQDGTPVADRRLRTIDAIIRATDIGNAEGRFFSRLSLELLTDAEIAAAAAIVDTKLAQIATAAKVSGAALTSLSSVPSGAGRLPDANLPTELAYEDEANIFLFIQEIRLSGAGIILDDTSGSGVAVITFRKNTGTQTKQLRTDSATGNFQLVDAAGTSVIFDLNDVGEQLLNQIIRKSSPVLSLVDTGFDISGVRLGRSDNNVRKLIRTDNASDFLEVLNTAEDTVIWRISDVGRQLLGVTPLDLMQRTEVNGENGGSVTVPAGGISILNISLGTVKAGDRILVAGSITIAKGVTGGQTLLRIEKFSGTATIQTFNDRTSIAIDDDTQNASTTFVRDGFGIIKVTGTGTLNLEIVGFSLGSDGTVAIGNGQLHAIVLDNGL